MGSFIILASGLAFPLARAIYGESVALDFGWADKAEIEIWKKVLGLFYDGNYGVLMPVGYIWVSLGSFYTLGDGTKAIGGFGYDAPRGPLPPIYFNYPNQEIYLYDAVSSDDYFPAGFRFSNSNNFYTFQFKDSVANFDKMVNGTLTYGIASISLSPSPPRTIYIGSVSSTHTIAVVGGSSGAVSDTSLSSGGFTVAMGADWGRYYNRRNGRFLCKPYGSMETRFDKLYRAFYLTTVKWDDKMGGYTPIVPLPEYSCIVDTDESGIPVDEVLVMSPHDVVLAGLRKLDKRSFLEKLSKRQGHEKVIHDFSRDEK